MNVPNSPVSVSYPTPPSREMSLGERLEVGVEKIGACAQALGIAAGRLSELRRQVAAAENELMHAQEAYDGANIEFRTLLDDNGLTLGPVKKSF